MTHYFGIVAVRFPPETEIMTLTKATALPISKEPGGT